MRDKANQSNIDKSNLVAYPNGRVKDDGGSGDGTPVNEQTKGDIHEFFDKLLRLCGVKHNGLPDNEVNGYQTIEALRGFANKNNYLHNLGSTSNVLSLPLKVGQLKDGEVLIVKASQDKGAETTIRGTLDNTSKSVVFTGSFLAGDYLRLVNTSTSINIVRLVDSANLSVIASELGFLKGASGAEVIEGVLANKALTPESFLEAFAEYVIGATSDDFLADIERNGLFSKEDKIKLDSLIGEVDRYGTVFIGDVDAGSVGKSYTVSGGISAAVMTSKEDDGEIIKVTLTEPMATDDYSVSVNVESFGILFHDNTINMIPWKKISTSEFSFFIEENDGETQNIKLHFDIKQR